MERTREQRLYVEGEDEEEAKAKGAKGLGGEEDEEDEEDEDEAQGAQSQLGLRRWFASGQSLGIVLILCELGVVWYVGVRGLCESALLRAFMGTSEYPCAIQSPDRPEGR